MTESLQLPLALANEMIDYCEAGRPHEACGILASSDGKVVRVFCMSNAARSPVRYSLDPEEQFAVYRKIEEEGWELAGVFHSHTHTEAHPSPTDVRLASEDVPYVIVSLADDPPDIRAYRIVKARWDDETGKVREIHVSVQG